MELKDIDTKDLALDLSKRQGVKSMEIKQGEHYRVRAAADDNTSERYIRVSGPAKILFIESEEA